MPRRPRIHYPGALYHVIARGVEKRKIFLDAEDYLHFKDDMLRSMARFNTRLLAYCLMPNHVHLAIKVGIVPHSRPMHRLLGNHAITFNEKYDRVGHLFQGRHSAYLVWNESYLSNLIRYIHQNPVRAKLVSRPKDWAWSSCTGDPREEDAIPEDFDPYFGGDDTSEDTAPELLRGPDAETKSLDSIGQSIVERCELSLDEFRSRIKRADVIAAKRLFATESAALGFTTTEIARWLGISAQAVGRYL